MKIAVLDDWLHLAAECADWRELQAEHQVDFYYDSLSCAALSARLQPYDILCLMRERTPVDAELIAQLPNLRALVTSGQRNQAIDLDAAKARGIVVCGTESPGHATAELAMTLIGALARQLQPTMAAMGAGGWQVRVGRDLRGARLGVLGLGRLGTQVAKLGLAFGMRVGAWSQNLTEERCAAAGVEYLDQQQFFQISDFITIHLKMSARVRHLVGARELAWMQRDAYLVNTSRAGIVDTDALVAALRQRQIAGAALDVYDIEPLPENSELRQVPGLLLTPHIGYVTRETMRVFYQQSVEAVQAYLRGEPVRLL